MICKGFSLTHFSVSNGVDSLNILESSDFASVCNHFSQVGADSLLVYTDRSLSNLGTVGCKAGTATFFEDIDLGLGIDKHFIMAGGSVISGNSRHFVHDIYCLHFDLHMAASFTSRPLANAHTYFMKALHHWLSVAVQKSNIWSVHAKHYAFMEKNRLIPLDSLVPVSVSSLVLELLARVVKLLGITNAFGVHFGFCKSCLFFSGVSDLVLVHIAA
ncbi:hypothetical protein G9A89_012868 [Geosiphon pyriformis]|nr:hypothetical protein G9A89_012868 [Geosiphon pyriformis]